MITVLHNAHRPNICTHKPWQMVTQVCGNRPQDLADYVQHVLCSHVMFSVCVRVCALVGYASKPPTVGWLLVFRQVSAGTLAETKQSLLIFKA